ncbi:hypothetical protein NS201_16705 [Pseudomonas oryzihabitans]|nr:hypothetical protein NS201_16705 [Pseudomonas psychrotolerans]
MGRTLIPAILPERGGGLEACSFNPLSPWERAGVRARLATKPSGKGCAVFHATADEVAAP